MILSALARLGPVRLPCCLAVQRTCELAFGATIVARAPGSLWNLWDPHADAWGPVTAAATCGLGVRVDAPVPGAWHVVQGWRTAPSATGSGHTFLLFVSASDPAVGLVADATEERALAVRPCRVEDLAKEFGHGLALCRLRRVPVDA